MFERNRYVLYFAVLLALVAPVLFVATSHGVRIAIVVLLVVLLIAAVLLYLGADMIVLMTVPRILVYVSLAIGISVVAEATLSDPVVKGICIAAWGVAVALCAEKILAAIAVRNPEVLIPRRSRW